MAVPPGENAVGAVGCRAEYQENLTLLAENDLLPGNRLDGVRAENLRIPQGCTGITLPAALLPQENESLYGIFPALREYIGETGTFVHLYFRPEIDEAEVLGYLVSRFNVN